MNLGRKTLLTLIAASSVTIALTFVVLKTTIYPTFIELERKWAARNTDTVEAAILAQLDILTAINLEYSQWDDAYEYLSGNETDGNKADFVTANISQDTIDYLDLDAFILLDSQGKLDTSFARGPDGLGDFQSSLPFLELASVAETLSVNNSESKPIVGVLGTSHGPLLLTSLPSLASDGSGTPAGSVLFIRMLAGPRIDELQRQLNIAFNTIAIDAIDSIPGAQLSLASPDTNSDGIVNVTNHDKLLTYKAIPDIAGLPGFVLEVATPREISAAGSSALNFALLFLAITSVLYLLVSNQSLKFMIVNPVSRLAAHLGRIQESGDLSGRLHSTRNDELGSLTRQSNMLVEQLDVAQNQLIESRDAALLASKAKSEFLATMSHEIRTPINGVLGMTELLLGTEGLNDQQRRYAKTVRQSGISLLRVINDILDISKIEAGKVELEIAPFNLRHSIEECLELLAESAHRKGIELIGAISLDTHTYVQGDSVRLSQVLTNLIGNAVKFTESGEIMVSVTEGDDCADTPNYRFEVKDTGIGISLKNKDGLFEPFSQEDGSTTRRYGGTGLGLSICKNLIELMGGEIGVTSMPGQGSTFWFTAQLTKDEETSQFPQPELLAGTKALIVDDNDTNREILRHQLEGWHMQVAESCSGSGALDQLVGDSRDGRMFDLVLLDMHMPEMDGLQLAQAIRREPNYRHIPLVMLSSVSGADVCEGRDAEIPDAWLTKPVRQARLHDTLVSLLGKAALYSSSGNVKRLSEDAGQGGSGCGLRILLAEDNEVNQDVATAMLESLGHQITVASNGHEAVTAFQSHEFDLVMMDCRMPELDGYDATRAIRQWEEQQDLPPTPIIALTANALEGDRDRCLAAGMSEYLSKPFTKMQLSEVITSNSRANDPQNDRELDVEDRNQAIDDSADDSPVSKGRVLVVEDDIVTQQVTHAILKALGYDATVVDNGDDALRAMSLERFDLVLMDCHMPVLDGYETSIEIRSRERKSRRADRIPIVAITADFLQSNRQRCIECGMDDYVTKPFTQEHMRILLTRWLQKPADEDSAPPVAIDTDGFSDLGEHTALASINREMLEELYELDRSPDFAVVREIVISYCAISTNLMLRLRSAVAEGDRQSIELIAHSLKGSSGQVGAVLLASLCEHLISSAKRNDQIETQTLFERTAIEHGAVIAGLDKELQRIAA